MCSKIDIFPLEENSCSTLARQDVVRTINYSSLLLYKYMSVRERVTNLRFFFFFDIARFLLFVKYGSVIFIQMYHNSYEIYYAKIFKYFFLYFPVVLCNVQYNSSEPAASGRMKSLI